MYVDQFLIICQGNMMFFLLICLWLTLPGFHARLITYTGAVVEYRPFNEWATGPESILKKNAQTMVNFAVEAKLLGADIIVYPEYGLTGQNLGDQSEEFLKLTQIVPHPNTASVPCLGDENKHTFEALRKLSCAARDQEIYMVVSLAEWMPAANPNVEDTFHNTQVVFDRRGTVCARSRKKSLFFEDEFTPGVNISETALFTTDFGVSFSLQTSFDIMYAEPGLTNIVEKVVKDVLISAFWIDGLPFLTAPQIFSAWAEGLGVNVLISNYHIREKGGTGSGIFTGFTNHTNSYVYDPSLVSALILKNITTEANRIENPDIVDVGWSIDEQMAESELSRDIIIKTHNLNESESQFFVYEDLTNYTSVIVNAPGSWLTVDHCYNENFCCTLKYTLDEELTEGKYQLISFDGIVGRGEGVYEMYIQVCSVVYCLNDDITSCGNVSGFMDKPEAMLIHQLGGTFQTEFVYPSVLTTSLKLLDVDLWNFGRMDEDLYSHYLQMEESVDETFAATLYGRYYERDPL